MKKTMGKLFWNLYAFCYDGLNDFKPYKEMMNNVLERLCPLEKVLDASCGTGNLENLIIKKYGRLVTVTAVDFSPEMLKKAEKKCKGATNVKFLKLDLNRDLPLLDGEFDKVVSINTLYNLDAPEFTLGEFMRILKPNGELILITPKKNSRALLILKAHRYKHESEKKWRTENFIGWLWLVFRTFGVSGTAFKFIFVAIFNKKIFKTMKVFEKDELEMTLRRVGFTVLNSGLTYGDQTLIMVAAKIRR